MIHPLNSNTTHTHTNSNANAHGDVNTKKSHLASANIKFSETSILNERQGINLLNEKTDSKAMQPLRLPEEHSAEARTNTIDGLSNLSMDHLDLDITAVVMLFYKLSQENRNKAFEVRHAEVQMEVQTYLNSAQKIRDSAKQRMIGALTASGTQILGGALQGSLSVTQFGRANATDGDFKITQGRRIDSMGYAAGEAFGSTGKLGQSILDESASIRDAEKAELDAKARMHDHANQIAREISQQMLDIIRDMRGLLQEQNQARKDTRIVP